MKKYLMLISILVTGGLAAGQTNPKLLLVLEKLRVALQDPTPTNLNELVAARLTYGHSSGMIETKQGFISNLVSGTFNFEQLEFSDIIVTENKNTAIIRHILKAKSLDAGKEPGQVHLKVMTVWTKEKGNWKLMGRQAIRA